MLLKICSNLAAANMLQPPATDSGHFPDMSGLNLPLVSNNFSSPRREVSQDLSPGDRPNARAPPALRSAPSGRGIKLTADSAAGTALPAPASVAKASSSVLAAARGISEVGGPHAPDVAASDSVQRPQVKQSYAGVTDPNLVRKPDVSVHRCSLLQPKTTGDFVTVTIPREIYQHRVQEFQYAIIGRLLLRKGDKPRTLSELQSELQRLWNPKSSWKIIPMGKSFYSIRFSSPADRSVAKEKVSWDLTAGFFRVRDWVRNFDPYKEISSICQVWVRIYCLPIEYWVPEVLAGIGRAIGTPIKVDSASAQGDVGHYARILVEVDLALPLLQSVNIDCDDTSFFVEFSFEKLPLYCYKCQLTGHSTEKCTKAEKKQRVLADKLIPAVADEQNLKAQEAAEFTMVKRNNWRQKDGVGNKQVQIGSGSPIGNRFVGLAEKQPEASDGLTYVNPAVRPDLLASVLVPSPDNMAADLAAILPEDSDSEDCENILCDQQEQEQEREQLSSPKGAELEQTDVQQQTREKNTQKPDQIMTCDLLEGSLNQQLAREEPQVPTPAQEIASRLSRLEEQVSQGMQLLVDQAQPKRGPGRPKKGMEQSRLPQNLVDSIKSRLRNEEERGHQPRDFVVDHNNNSASMRAKFNIAHGHGSDG